jgi:hypothetical protein
VAVVASLLGWPVLIQQPKTDCFIDVSFLLHLGCFGVVYSIAATATLVTCLGFLCVLSFGLSDCFHCWLIVLVPK